MRALADMGRDMLTMALGRGGPMIGSAGSRSREIADRHQYYRLSRRIVLRTELWDRHRKIQYKYQCFVYHANSPPDRQTIQTGDSVRGSGTTLLRTAELHMYVAS